MHDRRAKELLFAVPRIDRCSGIAHAKELQDFDLSGLCQPLLRRLSLKGTSTRALFRLARFWVHVSRRGLADSFCGKSSAETAELGQKFH